MAGRTKVIRIDPRLVMPRRIAFIARVLREKGVIVYPTDTFYGLGACCFSQQAVERIYFLKKREASKPISVVVADLSEVEKIARDIPPLFWRIAQKFWPGPLTLILKASPEIPGLLLGPSRTIGVRLPALEWLRQLVREAGFPVTATSANISSEGDITQVEKIIGLFSGKVELIVDGGRVRVARPSTVLDLTAEGPKILREGALSTRKLMKFLEQEKT